jgi:hypothetical protein
VSFNFNNVAEIEDELFSLSNQSTLVARFLELSNIKTNTPRLRNVHRTHIKGWPVEQ